MPAPRLKGTALSAMRLLASWGPTRSILRRRAFRDYGIDHLLSLRAEARLPLDIEARPLQARPPRAWEDAGLPDPPCRRDTARSIQAAFREGRADPAELLERIQERIDAGGWGLCHHGPFVALAMERAAEAAHAAALRLRAGTAWGPLDGVPVPVKDEHDMKGIPTRGGTAYRNLAATGDSFLVRQLEAAGALVYAKTHTTEWGMDPRGVNPHFDMPRNPYRADRGAGGSSTGSAVAVALGLAPLAVGSDGGGSIRIPASLCGLYGLKPTFIRVGRTGDIFADGTVSHIGPIGASVTDLVDFLLAVALHADPRDPVAGYAPDLPGVAAAWKVAPGRGVRGCRIGLVRGEWEDAHPGIAAAGQEALRALESDGAVLADVDLSLARHAGAIGVLAIGMETMGNLADDCERHDASMGEDLRVALRLLQSVSGRDYLQACRSRAALRRQAAAALSEVDLLALPTTACPAPAHPLSEDGVASSDDAPVRAMCRFNFLGNLTGLPAGTVPAGMVDGTPAGIQFMGDAWDEASVLAAMAHCQRMEIGSIPPPEGWLPLLG